MKNLSTLRMRIKVGGSKVVLALAGVRLRLSARGLEPFSLRGPVRVRHRAPAVGGADSQTPASSCHGSENARVRHVRSGIVDSEEGTMSSGAAAVIAVLMALVGVVLRTVIAANRVDRAKARAQDTRARSTLNRASKPSAPRVYREPPPGVGYREPRPPINSPEALARFRDTNPPGITLGPNADTPPRGDA